MNFYERAKQLKEETISHRRYFHKNAETGLDMPMAREYVMNTLSSFGYTPQLCGNGVTATVGKGSPVILLRADMDALPMKEESGEEFSCENGNMHACGHDLHAAMLLTAAKILKECEDGLKGTVKFMFQPAEETFEGARDMINAGILENPKPDVALAFHVTAGKMPVGMFAYNSGGVMMNSVDGFRIEVTGKGSHGAYPSQSVDPIMISCHIHQALQSLIAREADSSKNCVLTIGSFHAGSAANIIPEKAVMEGTLRTDDVAEREKLKRRLSETVTGIASSFGGKAEITELSAVPPLICNKEFTDEIADIMETSGIEPTIRVGGVTAGASEDFALITEQIPGALMYISAGFMDERVLYPAHNPKVIFNEEALVVGSTLYSYAAYRWLESKNMG